MKKKCFPGSRGTTPKEAMQYGAEIDRENGVLLEKELTISVF